MKSSLQLKKHICSFKHGDTVTFNHNNIKYIGVINNIYYENGEQYSVITDKIEFENIPRDKIKTYLNKEVNLSNLLTNINLPKLDFKSHINLQVNELLETIKETDNISEILI